MQEPIDGGDTSSDTEDVRAGLQGNVRLFIFHSSLVFFTPTNTDTLDNKVKIAGFIRKIFSTDLSHIGSSAHRQFL